VKSPGFASGKSWALASLAGVVIIVGLAYEIRVPEAGTPAESPPKPSVGLVDPVVIRGTMLFDLTPLFLPTQFNSSRKDYQPSEPGGGFPGFPAQHVFDDVQLDLHLPPATAVPSTPAQALVGDPPGAPFLGFGRETVELEPIAPRAAYVEILNAGTGRRVFGGAVSDAHPPAASWRPVEFIAAVDSAGLVGPPVLTLHSDAADVDAYFGRYLADTLRLGQRLAPGFYRVCIGP
jgi:hypothetical protein